MSVSENDTLTVGNVTYCWYEELDSYSWCPLKSSTAETVSMGMSVLIVSILASKVALV